MITLVAPGRGTTALAPGTRTRGISKSEVSRICGDLDVRLTAFRNRVPLEKSSPLVAG